MQCYDKRNNIKLNSSTIIFITCLPTIVVLINQEICIIYMKICFAKIFYCDIQEVLFCVYFIVHFYERGNILFILKRLLLFLRLFTHIIQTLYGYSCFNKRLRCRSSCGFFLQICVEW